MRSRRVRNRAIDDQVTGAHHRAADEVRVELDMQAHFALQALLQRRRQFLLLRFIEAARRK